jgi:predicted nucleic acid-binding protein
MAFFDTNVLLYAAANNDPRASKAEALSLAAALQGFNH